MVFRIATEADWDALLLCRWKGYKQYGYATPEECRNRHDGRATQLICRDEVSGEVLGCLRMLSNGDGPLELEEFVEISKWTGTGVMPGTDAIQHSLEPAAACYQKRLDEACVVKGARVGSLPFYHHHPGKN